MKNYSITINIAYSIARVLIVSNECLWSLIQSNNQNSVLQSGWGRRISVCSINGWSLCRKYSHLSIGVCRMSFCYRSTRFASLCFHMYVQGDVLDTILDDGNETADSFSAALSLTVHHSLPEKPGGCHRPLKSRLNTLKHFVQGVKIYDLSFHSFLASRMCPCTQFVSKCTSITMVQLYDALFSIIEQLWDPYYTLKESSMFCILCNSALESNTCITHTVFTDFSNIVVSGNGVWEFPLRWSARWVGLNDISKQVHCELSESITNIVMETAHLE